jgi:Zn-finger nucleic acid-binding protein
MTDSWKDMRMAKEEQYFEKRNAEKLATLRQKRRGGDARKSPVTSSPMKVEEVCGILVDVCTDCGGVWLDDGELEELAQLSVSHEAEKLVDFFKEVRAIAKNFTPVDSQGEDERVSPVTGHLMEKIVVSGVTLDRCVESGGAWFDGGELEEVINKSSAIDDVKKRLWFKSFFEGFTGIARAQKKK